MSKPKNVTQHSRWPLLEVGYADGTVKKYKTAVKRFRDWCKTNNEDPQTYDELDECLADYFHQIYELKEGKGKQIAKDTIYGIQMYLPRTKDKLLISSHVTSRWSKMQPAVSYPPLTWELTVLIAVQMTRSGRSRLGVGTLLAFDCLLRVGELTALRREDVAFPKDHRMGAEYQVTTIAIQKAKTGRNQSVVVKNPEVVQELRALVDRSKPRALLFPGGAATFRKVFKDVCAELALSPKYVPHSLRHGGATRLHLQGVPLEDIMMRGRWASAKSARTYVQASRAVLMASNPPEKLVRVASLLADNVQESLSLAQKH